LSAAANELLVAIRRADQQRAVHERPIFAINSPVRRAVLLAVARRSFSRLRAA